MAQALQTQIDTATRRRVLNGIVHQVDQHLSQTIGITFDDGLVLVQQVQFTVYCPAFRLAVDLKQERIELDRLAGDGMVTVGLSQQQQIGDKAAHVLGFRLDLAQHFLAVGDRETGCTLEQADVTEDGREGGAQLVRDVAGEAPLFVEELLESRQHLVERADQGAHLVVIVAGPGDRHPTIQAAGAGDLQRRGRGLLDGTQGDAGQPIPYTGAQGQDNRRHPEEVDRKPL